MSEREGREIEKEGGVRRRQQYCPELDSSLSPQISIVTMCLKGMVTCRN